MNGWASCRQLASTRSASPALSTRPRGRIVMSRLSLATDRRNVSDLPQRGTHCSERGGRLYCPCWHRAGPSSRRPEGRPPMTVTNPRQVGGSRAHDEAFQWLRLHPVADDSNAQSIDVLLAPSPRTTKHSFPIPKGPASFHARRGTRRAQATACITSQSSTPTKSWPSSHPNVPIGLTSQQRPHGAGITRI